MMLEMIVYENGNASLIFNYIKSCKLEIDSIKLIESDISSTNIMVMYIWCTAEQKEELIRIKKIEDQAHKQEKQNA